MAFGLVDYEIVNYRINKIIFHIILQFFQLTNHFLAVASFYRAFTGDIKLLFSFHCGNIFLR